MESCFASPLRTAVAHSSVNRKVVRVFNISHLPDEQRIVEGSVGQASQWEKRNDASSADVAPFGVSLRYADALMRDEGAPAQPKQTKTSLEGRLDSWKEIATFLCRGIRTV